MPSAWQDFTSSMTRKRAVPIVGLLLIGACLGLVFFGWIGLNRLRTNLREMRPLVLIHNPSHQQQFPLGEAIALHATAREKDGVESIELWVDGDFVTREEITEGNPTLMVLDTFWTAETAGPHNVVVRARSAKGVDGQASLRVEVLDEPVDSDVGDDVATEEVGFGMGEDEGSVGETLAPSGESAPAVEPPAPGSMEDAMDRMELPPRDEDDTDGEGGARRLRVELLALQTDRHYGGLHCYFGVGEILPRWYPDADGDQRTDESFPSLGLGAWDVASSLSGDSAPTFLWNTLDPLPMDVTCVGLTHSGTGAVEIGRVFESLGPEAWDGIARRVESVDIEGHFSLDYRIGPADGSVPGVRIELDPGMTPPTDLRLGAWTLEWNYEPRPGEEAIDGFRIWLNGTLQWTEPADARRSYLPYEWVNPPCGRHYDFFVDAYRDEDWSPSSNTITISGSELDSEECERTLIVTFETLETFNLGNDEDHAGWIGPTYGSFYVGDYQVTFDGRCLGTGLCDFMGLSDDTTYSISGILSHWGSGGPRFVVNVPPGEDLVVGFNIRDYDWAPWNQDDTVCADWRYIWDEDMDQVQHSGIGSYGSVCDVSFTVGPAFGSAVEDPSGQPPLPMLSVTNLTVDEESGRLEIHVINGGRATWPARDLDVVLTWPAGTAIGQYVFPELVLRPGETEILTHPDMTPGPHPPLGACVLLDPGNQVPEEDDYIEGWTRERYCRPLPDLTISDVILDQTEDRMLVTVQNAGAGSLEDRTLDLEIRLDESTTLEHFMRWYQISMGAWESKVLVLENVSESVRRQLMDGYQVIVDPDNAIAEEDGFNNTYTVPAGGSFRMVWGSANVPFYEFVNLFGQVLSNADTFDTRVIAETESTTRLIADWTVSCDVHEMADIVPFRYCLEEAQEVEFELEGDETLAIFISGEMHIIPVCLGACDYHLGSAWIRIPPEEWSLAAECEDVEHRLRVNGTLYPPLALGESWSVSYSVCRIGR